MDAPAELGRNPVTKHQYGAILKGLKEKIYKKMILPFTLVLVRCTEGRGKKTKNDGV